MATPRPTSAIRNWTIRETSVTYVRPQVSVNVFKIAAIATMIGIRIAGIVPKTKSRMIKAPPPPISASVNTPGPLVDLVRRVARNRELVEPPLVDLAGGEGAEDGEDEPTAEDKSAMAYDKAG